MRRRCRYHLQRCGGRRPRFDSPNKARITGGGVGFAEDPVPERPRAASWCGRYGRYGSTSNLVTLRIWTKSSRCSPTWRSSNRAWSQFGKWRPDEPGPADAWGRRGCSAASYGSRRDHMGHVAASREQGGPLAGPRKAAPSQVRDADSGRWRYGGASIKVATWLAQPQARLTPAPVWR
jgi:hypothetical protein